MTQVVLVDEKDRQIGLEEKLKAHREAKLHRGFSVFLFNSKGELLLQKRAEDKYHSSSLWTNTCCSHPRPDEGVGEAAERRLWEEMGIKGNLSEITSFIYKVNFENGLTEHEFLHVFIGKFDGGPKPDPSEVADWKWEDPKITQLDLEKNPQDYTYWFTLCFKDIVEKAKAKNLTF